MGWDNLLDQYIYTKYQGATKRRDICPRCGEVNRFMETPRGLHCGMCGWTEALHAMPFIPRTPENPPT